MNPRPFLPIAAAVAVLTAPGPAQARINVVATTPDLGALARDIGGDRVEVTVLAKATEDPHFVDAKPSFIVKLNRADALFEGGAELESGWLPPLLDGARNAKLDAGRPGRISCAKGIRLLEIPPTLDRSRGDLHALGNPHYTTDPLNGQIIAETLREAFSRIEPKSADVFKANLNKFEVRLQAKLTDWRKRLAPFQGKRIVAYHNYWIYFADRFGLRMDLYLEPKPGIPPSPSHLAQVVRTMKAEDIRVIAVQPYVSRKTAEAVARLAGATVVDLDAFPNARLDEGGYLEWIDSLVNKLADALAGKN